MVRLGLFATDPVACDAFHARDAASAAIYPAIADSLVYLDSEGVTKPGLARAWRRIDPYTVEFDLREGVRFHNGERFTADDVVATLQSQPGHLGLNGHAILPTIAECTKQNEFCVRVRTNRPDGALLHRLHAASAIYPRSLIESKGTNELLRHPIGTGAYVFERWEPGHEIVLSRNPDHFADAVSIHELRLPIIDRKDWLDALRADQLDILWNIDPNDAMRVESSEDVVVKRRDTGLSHWFALGQNGPLADRRVRLALEYAVHRPLLCSVAGCGYASPQISLSRPRQVGHDDKLPPYPYEPDRARQLLVEAGYPAGFSLRGLVCESSSTLFHMVRAFLARIGVKLDADIVPRPQWMARVVARKIDLGETVACDFTLIDIGNVFSHPLLQQALFLHSEGPFSLLSSPEYDSRFADTCVQIAPEALDVGIRALDRYAYDEALILFTIRQQLHCAMRPDFDMPISRTGHPTCDSLWRIQSPHDTADRSLVVHRPKIKTDVVELQRLLDATSYPGTLYETEHSEGPVLARLWRNMELHEVRWKIQARTMLRTMVDLVSATTNLDNVLRSTKQIAILGITHTGRVLFENSGYRHVMGHGGDTPLGDLLYDDQGHRAWDDIRALTDASGVSNETVTVRVSDSDERRVFLSVTHALNENGNPIGYMCIATDHSREEERLRIRQEMELARRVQAALLPSVAAEENDVLSAVMLPAEEVGGDYYDIVTDADGHTWYGIGDVSGHGVTPGLMMLMARCVIRGLLHENPGISMNRMLATLNRVMYDDIQQMGHNYHFTVSLIKSLGDGDYVAAGAHEDIIVHRARTGQCERVQLTGMWIGFVEEVSGMFEEVPLHLEPGDIMVLYTDGFIEAESDDGTMWESRRFMESISRHAHLPADQMRQAIVADVQAFMDEQYDDMTMMIVKRPA